MTAMKRRAVVALTATLLGTSPGVPAQSATQEAAASAAEPCALEITLVIRLAVEDNAMDEQNNHHARPQTAAIEQGRNR